MRYLAICCLLMLAIALAHAIPSQRFNGLRSLAKAKSEKRFGGPSAPLNRLRSLLAKSGGQQSLQLRQEGKQNEEETAPVCEDICRFDLIWDWAWYPQVFQLLFDSSLNCTEDKVKEMEYQFVFEYHIATGDELVSDKDLKAMWAERKSDLNLENFEERLELEEQWQKDAMDKFEAKGVQPTPGLPEKYDCLVKKVYGTLWFLECLEEYDYDYDFCLALGSSLEKK